MLSFTWCSVDLWSGHQHSLFHPFVQQPIAPGGSIVNWRVDILWIIYDVWTFLFSYSLQFCTRWSLCHIPKQYCFYLFKEIFGPKFEPQNEKLLLTTLTYYFPSCPRFVAFAIAKTFQNTLIKWNWKSFMHILWKKLQIYLLFWVIKYVFSWTIKIFCSI